MNKVKIIINKEAEKVLNNIKKRLVCSDSTAILVMYELMKDLIMENEIKLTKMQNVMIYFAFISIFLLLLAIPIMLGFGLLELK